MKTDQTCPTERVGGDLLISYIEIVYHNRKPGNLKVQSNSEGVPKSTLMPSHNVPNKVLRLPIFAL